ncbi:MAG: SDR family NAD(P)-dependent oxidoreductase, partial [Porticoccaceae bacterium]|nr:SDR family NAD(P)-dependent oxidoreductase [Porticoccaceae bacterium]
MNTQNHPTATANWITGASRGIGRALTEYYLAAGQLVWASARDCQPLQPLQQQYPQLLTLLPLDITDADAVQHTVATLLAQTDGQPLRVVLNAG